MDGKRKAVADLNALCVCGGHNVHDKSIYQSSFSFIVGVVRSVLKNCLIKCHLSSNVIISQTSYSRNNGIRAATNWELGDTHNDSPAKPNSRRKLIHKEKPPQFPSQIHHRRPSTFLRPRPNFVNPTSSSRNRRGKPLAVNADSGGSDGAKTKATAPFISDESVSFVGEDNVPLEGVIQFEKPELLTDKIQKWGKVALLAGGDVLAILIFSAIGRLSHGFSVFDTETLQTADPFLAGWFLSAYFLGGYGEDGRGLNGQTSAIMAAVKSWGLGIPLGIVIRTTKIGHVPPINFILVTMGSTAVLLIGWRALLSNILPGDKNKKNDVYKRGSPFELFELLTSLVRRW